MTTGLWLWMPALAGMTVGAEDERSAHSRCLRASAFSACQNPFDSIALGFSAA